MSEKIKELEAIAKKLDEVYVFDIPECELQIDMAVRSLRSAIQVLKHQQV